VISKRVIAVAELQIANTENNSECPALKEIKHYLYSFQVKFTKKYCSVKNIKTWLYFCPYKNSGEIYSTTRM
jgi:hypothetical protein